MFNVTKKEMINFIKNNQKLLDEYDVKDLYKKVLKKSIDNHFDYYFEIKNYNNNQAPFLIDESESLAVNIRRLTASFKEACKLTGVSQGFEKTYSSLKSVVDSYYFRITRETKNVLYFSNPSYGLDTLLQMLLTCITGEIKEDYQEINTWKDENSLKYDSQFDYVDFHGIQISRNGTSISVKGASEELKASIKKMLSDLEKFNKYAKYGRI